MVGLMLVPPPVALLRGEEVEPRQVGNCARFGEAFLEELQGETEGRVADNKVDARAWRG